MKRTKAERECAVCKKSFVPKKIDSKYCTPKCGDIAYRKKKALEKKEEQKQAVANISDNRLYISVSEAIGYSHQTSPLVPIQIDPL